MTFEQFAVEHGLLINGLIFDRWVRVGTVDHPNKKNGAYIFDGRKGALINFATHEKHIPFTSQDPYVYDPTANLKRQKADQERLERQTKAKQKAATILHHAKEEAHPYLERKGFADSKGYVWNSLLILPMRIAGALVGCQMIAADGTKRFLTGQITKGASLKIDTKGRDIVCEGFATGMSVRRAMRFLKQRYTIHVCFSASNMLEIGRQLENPLVIADNDAMGVSTAKKIASRYWIGEAGEDFNDTEQRIGTELVAESLRGFI